jgi:hypothetical protein
LDVQAVLGEVDLLQARVAKSAWPADAGPVQKLRILQPIFLSAIWGLAAI